MPVDSFITVFIQCHVGLENKLIRAPLLDLAKSIYYNLSRDESPQGVNEMCDPSFEEFHGHLDCKPAHGNRDQTQLTLVQYINFRVQKKKQNKTGMIKDKTKLAEIHTTHDGVRATAIMLRSISAGRSWRSPVIAMKQALEITSASLRVNN